MNTLNCYQSLHIKESILIFLTSILHKFSESNSLQYFSQNFVAKFPDIERRSRYVMLGMVVKFLDDNKPKMSLKKWIHTVSNFSDLVQFHLICQMLAKFSGVKSERTVSKFRERKRKLLCSFKLEHEIRKFQVTVMQWRLRSVQKSVMHMQSYCFANKNLLLFLLFLAPSPLLLHNLPVVLKW